MSNIEPMPSGTVTSPNGFLAGATYAGLKTRGDGVLDVGILYSERPCNAAGLFTTNKVKAAPVLLSRKNIAGGSAQAIVVNAGRANACVGDQGLRDAAEMAQLAAAHTRLAPGDVLVASTGVIGVPIPMDLLRRGIPRIELTHAGGHSLARAMMTTDTRPKEVAVSLKLSGKPASIGGVAKGVGMIHPNLATMLCFLSSDAAVDSGFLQAALRRVVERTFNMVTVDGDTSTNDTVLLLANGMAGNRPLDGSGPDSALFEEALLQACTYLARSIARDGEGATRLIEVTVEGAAGVADARLAARTVAASSLFKAAVHGADPNWGRILAAVGRSGADVVEGKTEVYLGALPVFRAGSPVPFDKDAARAFLLKDEVFVRIRLNLGEGAATAWGCDLSEEYATINSAYST